MTAAMLELHGVTVGFDGFVVLDGLDFAIEPGELRFVSGGQQQQLAIARALVQRPRLLVLDEPTEGIQPSIVGEIEAVVQALRAERGTTILLVEQFLDFAVAVADRYYVMEGGTIVAHGVGVELADDTVRRHLAV